MKSEGTSDAQWPRHRGDEAVDAASVSGLQPDRWSDVADRLLPRVLTTAEAGPLARPLGSGLVFDVGIDLGAERYHHSDVPSAAQVEAWGRSRVAVWARAQANSFDRPLGCGATVHRRSRQPVILVTGDRWLTRVLFDLDQLPALRRPADRSPPRRFVSVLGPTALLVIDHPSLDASSSRPERLVRRRAELVVSDWFSSGTAMYPKNLLALSGWP